MSSFQFVLHSLYLSQPPYFTMGHVDTAEIASLLFALELPPLTKDQENNLTDDERANREKLARHIERLHNIGMRINHCAMVGFS